MPRTLSITALIALLAAFVAVATLGINSWLRYADRIEHATHTLQEVVQYQLRDHLDTAIAAGETPAARLRNLSRLLEPYAAMAEIPPFVALLDGAGRFHAAHNLSEAVSESLKGLEPGASRGVVDTGPALLVVQPVAASEGAVVFGVDKGAVRAGLLPVALFTALAIAMLLLLFTFTVRLLLHHRLERPFSELMQNGMASNLDEAVAGLDDVREPVPEIRFLPRRLAHQVSETFQMLALWRRNKAHLERLLSFGIRETDKQELLAVLEQSLRELFGVTTVKVSEVNASQNRLEPVYAGGEEPSRAFSEELLGEPESCFVYRTGSSAVHTPENELCRWCSCHREQLALCMPLVGGGQEIGICTLVLDRRVLEEKVPMSWSHARKVRLVESFLRPYLNLMALALNSINMQDAYRNRAITDGLTGLYNRRYAVEYLSNMVNIAKRGEKSVGVLVVDIDWFKRFNDEYGHKVGDQVLEQVAHAMRATVRDGDLVARYGGEEFIIVLPDADLEAAGEIGERVRSAVAGIEWDAVGLPGIPPVTISLGLAMFPEHGYSHYHLINAADKALYAAKNGGKNRLTVHTHLPPQQLEAVAAE